MMNALPAIFALLVPVAVSARPAPTPTTPPADTVETWTEGVFENMTGRCNVNLPKAFRDKRVKFTPSEIRDQLRDDLKKSYIPFSGAKLSALFDTVFSKNGESYAPVGSSMVFATELAFDRQFSPHRDNFTYTHDCLTILSSALRSNASLNLGFLSSKAAVMADVLSDRSRAVSIISGTFNSPAQQLRDGLAFSTALWDWYRNNRDRIGQVNYSLNSVRGLAKYDIDNLMWQTKYSGTLEGSAGGGVPAFGISVSGSGKAEFTGNQTFNANNFRIIAFPQGQGITADAVGYVQLDDIAVAAANALAASRMAAIQPTSLGKPVSILNDEVMELEYLVPGLAAGLCDTGWSISSTGASGFSNLVGGTPSAIGNGCQFRLSFTPPGAKPNVLNLPLGVALTRSFTVGSSGNNTKTYPLTLVLGAATASDLRGQLRFRALPTSEIRSSDGFVTGTLAWQIENLGGTVVSGVQPSDLSVRCGTSPESPMSYSGVTFSPPAAGSPGKLSLRFSIVSPSNLEAQVRCVVGGFALVNTTIKRALEMQSFVVSPPPVAANGATGSTVGGS